jgi:hypothetical protein
MFQINFVQRIKTHILCSETFSRKSCRLRNNVEKHGRDRQATDDHIIRRMRFPCLINEATDTHIGFPWQMWLREFTPGVKLDVHCLSC